MAIGDVLAELIVKITADTASLNKALGDAEKKIDATVGHIEKAAKSIGIEMMAMGGVIVGAAVLSIKSYAEMGSEIHDLALKTGFATETLSELSYMAKQSGTSLEGMEVGIKKLQGAIHDATLKIKDSSPEIDELTNKILALEKASETDEIKELEKQIAKIDPKAKGASEQIKTLRDRIAGIRKSSELDALKQQLVTLKDKAKEVPDAFTQLGLKIEDIKALKPEEQFWKVAEALAAIPDPTTRAALAVDLFGRSGTDLLPILAEGKAGMEAMKQKAKELGVVFDAEAAAKADRLGDAMTDLETSTMGLRIAVAEAITPAVQKLAEDMTKMITKVMEWTKANPELANTILKVGVALIGAGGLLFAITKIIAVVRAMAAAFAVAQAFMGPSGWLMLAGAALAAAGAIALINQLIEGTSEATKIELRHPEITGYQYGGIIPGTGPQLAMVHGGETIIPAGGGGGGMSVVVNVAGSVIAERDLAQTLRRELLMIQDRNYSTGIA